MGLLSFLKRKEKRKEDEKKQVEVVEIPYQRLVLPNGKVVKVLKVLSVSGDHIVVQDIYGKILKIKIKVKTR